MSLPSSMRSNLAQYKQLTFFRDKTGSRSRGSSSSRLPSHRFNLDRIASRFKNPAPQSHDISSLYTNTYCICLYMHKDILRDVIYTCLFTGDNTYKHIHVHATGSAPLKILTDTSTVSLFNGIICLPYVYIVLIYFRSFLPFPSFLISPSSLSSILPSFLPSSLPSSLISSIPSNVMYLRLASNLLCG